jgi:hypothetical protein
MRSELFSNRHSPAIAMNGGSIGNTGAISSEGGNLVKNE